MAKQEVKQQKQSTATAKLYLGRYTASDLIGFAGLAFTLIIIYIIRSHFFEIPFERDEGAYGYYGKLLLEGKVPYVDFYEQKFPGIFYFYATMVGLFGDTVKGLHLGFMFLNMATTVLLFFASRRMFGPYAALITAITYAIVSMTPALSGFTVQGEHGVAFFTSLGIYFYSFTLRSTSWKWYLFCGLATGAAFMVKTSGIFLALWGGLAIVSDFFFGSRERTVAEFFKRTLLYSAGVLGVIGVLFVVIAAKGSFNEMLFWAYEIPKRYVSTIPWEQGKQYLDYTYKAVTDDYKFFWLHAYCAVLVLLAKRIGWNLKVNMLLLMGLSWATIFPGYYFYGHYWIQILPGLAVVAGVTFYAVISIAGNFMKGAGGKIEPMYLGLFVVLTLIHLNKQKGYYFNPNYDRILRTVYGFNPFPETAKIADYIKANSKPEDNIVSFGSEPELYFYTQKKCPSRHAYFSALVYNTKEHNEWQREFVRDVEKASPRYIVFYNHSISLMVQPNTDRYIWEWYDKYIQNYNLIAIVDMLQGYMTSNYVWKDQVAGYKPQSQYVIYLYERKPSGT
jgi:hypothetical protein